MKKLIAVALAIVLTPFVMSCSDDEGIKAEKTISVNELPQQARDFIASHFPQHEITLTTHDQEDADYSVWLNNEFSLEFNTAGSWNEIDSKGTEIPGSILSELPEALTSYLSANYANNRVVRLEAERNVYEVELSNWSELIFDINGNFMGFDD